MWRLRLCFHTSSCKIAKHHNFLIICKVADERDNTKEQSLAGKEISISMRDMERLIDWMRRTGRPQTVQTMARRYLEMLREERGIRDSK